MDFIKWALIFMVLLILSWVAFSGMLTPIFELLADFSKCVSGGALDALWCALKKAV